PNRAGVSCQTYPHLTDRYKRAQYFDDFDAPKTRLPLRQTETPVTHKKTPARRRPS
ncbi:hypothetical protein THAOC_24743, partial [Thalassiosira oceanica]